MENKPVVLDLKPEFEPGFEPVISEDFIIKVYCGNCDKYVLRQNATFDLEIKDYRCLSCKRELDDIKAERKEWEQKNEINKTEGKMVGYRSQS